MTKIKITLTRKYINFDFITLMFDDYDEANNFMWTVLHNAEPRITATIELVNDGEKETDESNSND